MSAIFLLNLISILFLMGCEAQVELQTLPQNASTDGKASKISPSKVEEDKKKPSNLNDDEKPNEETVRVAKISGPESITMDEDSAAASFQFTLKGLAAEAVSVSALLDDSDLFPPDSVDTIVDGLNLTVTMTPAPDKHGQTTLTLAFTDTALLGTAEIPVTVNSVDDPPTLAVSGDSVVRVNTPINLSLTATDDGSLTESV